MAGFVHYLRLTNSVLLFLSTPFAEAGETGVPCFRGGLETVCDVEGNRELESRSTA